MPALCMATLCLAAPLLSACRTGGFTRTASDMVLLAFVEEGGQLRFSATRAGRRLVGVWEEGSGKKEGQGRVLGEIDASGGLSLLLVGAFGDDSERTLKARLSSTGEVLSGTLLVNGRERPISLLCDQSTIAGFRASTLSSSLPSISDPQKPGAAYSGSFLEPEDGGRIKARYRSTFHQGLPVAQFAKAKQDAFLARWKKVSGKFGRYFGPGLEPPWEEQVVEFLAFRRGTIVVLASSDYRYEGGAHGAEDFHYRILDFGSGRVLGLDDFIESAGKESLGALLEAEARRAQALEPGARLAQSRLYAEHIPPTDNVFIWSGGLGFHYPPYALAPYSEGPVELLLSWDELRDLLRPGIPKDCFVP